MFKALPLSLCLILSSSLVEGRRLLETVKVNENGAATRQVFEDGPFGGSGGSGWTDGGAIHTNGPITGMHLRTGNEVDAIQVRYGEVWGPEHGGGGGSLTTFTLNGGENINLVQGRHGKRIDQLEFFTNAGNVFGPYGGNGGSLFISSFPECELEYLSGAAGTRLDELTLHWLCPDDIHDM